MPGPVAVHLNVYSGRAFDLLVRYAACRSSSYKLFQQIDTNEIICFDYRCKDPIRSKESIIRMLIRQAHAPENPKKDRAELSILAHLIKGDVNPVDAEFKELFGEQLNPIAAGQITALLGIKEKVANECKEKCERIEAEIENERQSKFSVIDKLIAKARNGEVIQIPAILLGTSAKV